MYVMENNAALFWKRYVTLNHILPRPHSRYRLEVALPISRPLPIEQYETVLFCNIPVRY